MRVLNKKTVLLLVSAVLFLTLTGCGGGGQSNVVDKTKIQMEVQGAIALFTKAVGAYDVEGMLGFLDQEFSLTISEGSFSYYKNLERLREELEEVEDRQLRWRLGIEEEGGHGYALKMELDNFVYANEMEKSANAVVNFVIKESAAEIEEMITDQGSIVVEMVRKEGTWVCQKMTINFESLDSASSVSTASLARKHGLGFGTFFW